MHLIKDDIERIMTRAASAFCDAYQIPPDRLLDTEYVRMLLPENVHAEYADAVDFFVAGWVAQRAQTFLFDTTQIKQFLRSIDRQLAPGQYQPPFNEMVIQFSEPIPEQEFLTGIHTSGRGADAEDGISGLLLAFPGDRGGVINIIAWYTSTSINRVAVGIHGDGSISYAPIVGNMDDSMREQAMRDKRRIANLGLLCLAYMVTLGMEIERVQTDERVNRKREAKGKKPLPDYYICRWVGNRDRVKGGGSGEAGTTHGFRYDVTGHFRKLPDGRLTWVRPHQRGLEHEEYKPKVYRVD